MPILEPRGAVGEYVEAMIMSYLQRDDLQAVLGVLYIEISA